MKKSLLVIFSVLSLVFAVSCGKESKPTPNTGCPPITCEFGMDSVTCKCLPDPNDTTGNGNGNGGNDTTTAPVLRSKFGNGSNGTVDTTQNWAAGQSYLYWMDDNYLNFVNVFGGYNWQPTENYEVEINDVLRGNLTSPNIPTYITVNSGLDNNQISNLRNFAFSFKMLDIDSSLASNTYDVGFRFGSRFDIIFIEEPMPSPRIYDPLTNTFNFEKMHSNGHIILDNTTPFDEFNCKLQVLSSSATEMRMYMRAYIKYNGVRYVVKAEFKKPI